MWAPVFLWEVIRDLLFPPICSVCHFPRDEESLLCCSCAQELRPLRGALCSLCGVLCSGSDKSGGDILCFACEEKQRKVSMKKRVCRSSRGCDRVCSCYWNRTVAQRLVLQLKYAHVLSLAPLIGRDMLRWVREEKLLGDMGEASPWVVTFVPQSWGSRWRRGYNQAEEIARVFARGLGYPCRSFLGKKWNAASLTRLKRKERFLSAKESVFLKKQGRSCFSRERQGEDIPYTHILIIDDVYTTGATLDACARALRKMCPEAVIVGLTFVRS